MIKIDYEGAWKELVDEYGLDYIIIGGDTIENIQQKHTHNYIDIRKRSDKEIADYCLKKHAEIYMELICLKRKLKILSNNKEVT